MPVDVIPDSHRDLLDTAAILHLASLGPDGEPQVHPVWYDWQDGTLRLSTTRARQKLRNIERDPRVAATILDPDNDYRYLEVRGRVVAVDDDPDKKFIDFLAGKYLGRDEYPRKDPRAQRVVVSIEVEHANVMG